VNLPTTRSYIVTTLWHRKQQIYRSKANLKMRV